MCVAGPGAGPGEGQTADLLRHVQEPRPDERGGEGTVGDDQEDGVAGDDGLGHGMQLLHWTCHFVPKAMDGSALADNACVHDATQQWVAVLRLYDRESGRSGDGKGCPQTKPPSEYHHTVPVQPYE